MKMDGLGSERKKQRIEKDASPSRLISCSLAVDEQRRQPTAADETQQKEGEQAEHEDAPLITKNEKEKDDEDGWVVVGMVKEDRNLPLDSDVRPVMEVPYARWCQMLNDGRYQWDDTKLKCFLSQEDRNNLQLMRNLVCGTIRV